MKINAMYRYPVKGLSATSLDHIHLTIGEGLPFDRILAIAHGASAFDPKAPVWLRKTNFLVLMTHPALAAIEASFDGETRDLTLTHRTGPACTGRIDTGEGRDRLNAFLEQTVGTLSDGGPPRLVSAPNHRFFDVPQDYVSLIGLASIEDLGNRMGTTLDPLRFRANLYAEGVPAWAEHEWTGRTLQCGEVQVRVVGPIDRCAATNVNLETAEADLNIPAAIRIEYGHIDMGVYLEVIRPGRIAVGDSLTVT